jgi:AmmeMemoRadiSam system protein A
MGGALNQGGCGLSSLLVPPAEKSAAGEPADLSEADRQELLRIARVALAVAGETRPDAALLDAVNAALRTHLGEIRAAVFVTLFEQGELRGCMGALEPLRALPQAVADAALLAALGDPRFWPVGAGELPDIELEISVLGPMQPARRPEKIRLGTDGVMIEARGRRALLLPQVAPEQGWDAQQLWRGVSHKAGLDDDAWRGRGARLWIFQVARFGGPAAPPNGGQ